MELKSFIKDGVKYYQLFAPCPKCVELGHYVTPQKWICEKCGGDIYVGDNAHLYCPECENDFKMVFAHLGCPHCLQYGYENVVKFDPGIPHSYQELAFIGACMVHSPMWIKNFVEELVKQP